MVITEVKATPIERILLEKPEPKEKTKEKKPRKKEWMEEATEDKPRKDVSELKDIFKENYKLIKQVLKKYIVMKEEYYSLISLWVIGTYLHKEFKSYPYLFFNAMRGSAKTRTLKLVTYLGCDGIFLTSPTEAVLFRSNGTLGIDEFEGVANKDKSSIRELLNASYKKGIKVMRMKKKKGIDGESQVVEEFEPYRPIVMANIWGMEEVLGDRCINLVLEKSDDPIRTRLVEAYDEDDLCVKILKNFNQCRLCRVVLPKNIYKNWNNYISDKYKTTLNTYTHIQTHTTQTTLFNKIHDSDLKGRILELFMPIFIIADIIGEDVLDETLESAKMIYDEKKHDEEIESRDVMLLDFISSQEEGLIFVSIKNLVREFKEFADFDNNDDEDKWLNNKWFGRALKRLNLVIDKRRMARGREVMLNVTKAKEKLRLFRSEEKNQK